MSQEWRIGELSRRTGASAKALRLYESLGLIPLPRRVGSYRCYDHQHEEAVQLIRQAQAVGFKLQEMRQMLFDSAGRPSVERLLQGVREKRAALAAERRRLAQQDRLLARCEQLLLSGRLETDCDER